MSVNPIARHLTFQAQLDPTFGRRIADRAGGEDLSRCMQCGSCSATCPVSIYMDYSPRRVIAMTRAGFRDEVLASNTIWLCASCYACTADCPREIHITDVMYALKREAMEKGRYRKRFLIPVLAREFCAIVRGSGRNSEALLLLRALLKSDPWKLVRYAPMGLRLLGRGRLPLAERRPPGLGGKVRTLLGHVDRIKRGAAVSTPAPARH